MQFKKNLLVPIILSVLGIFLSVAVFIYIQIISRFETAASGSSPLAIFGLVLSVLFLSALSAKKPVFTKVVAIISIACMIVAAFIVSIVTSIMFQLRNVTWDSVLFLALSILSLVGLILFLIYFIIGKKGMLKQVSFITNLIVILLLLVFAIILIVSSVGGIYKTQQTPLYGIGLACLLITSALVNGIVLSLYNNLAPKDEEAE